jgi:hypothetical protein
MTDEHVFDPYAAERRMMFVDKIDELGLLLAGEYGEKARLVLDAVREELDRELSEAALDLFLQAILLCKIKIERCAMPARTQ